MAKERDFHPGVLHPEDHALFSCLPVFVLPRTVLFPQGALPLHVFEPRYQQMVAHARAPEGRGLLAIASSTGSAAESDVLPVAGLGRIVAHEPLADGRSRILVRGLARVRLQAAHEASAARMYPAHAVALIEERDAADVQVAMAELRALVRALSAHAPRAFEGVHTLLAEAPSATVVSDVMADATFSQPETRMKAMQLGTAARLRLLCGRLSEKLVTLESPSRVH